MKKKIFRLYIILLLLFSVFGATSHSFAWDYNINYDQSVNDSVATGTWQQAFQWDPNATYVVGDLVTNNGITYQAKKDSPTREPGVGNGWTSEWTAL